MVEVTVEFDDGSVACAELTGDQAEKVFDLIIEMGITMHVKY